MCEFRYLNKRTLQNQTRCKTSSATQGELELEFLPKFCVDHFETPQRAVHLCSVDQLLPWEDVPNHPGGYINPLSSNSNSDHRCKIHELIYRRKSSKQLFKLSQPKMHWCIFNKYDPLCSEEEIQDKENYFILIKQEIYEIS